MERERKGGEKRKEMKEKKNKKKRGRERKREGKEKKRKGKIKRRRRKRNRGEIHTNGMRHEPNTTRVTLSYVELNNRKMKTQAAAWQSGPTGKLNCGNAQCQTHTTY